MDQAITTFRVSTESDGRRALASLADAFEITEAAETPRRAIYLDTFEWRLYRDGSGLAWIRENGSDDLAWHALDGAFLGRWTLGTEPGFACDLPVGPLRERLTALVEMRRLLPVARIDGRRRRIGILDRRDKTVVRIAFDRGFARDPDRAGRRCELARTVSVIPLRGYAGEHRRVVEVLSREPGLGLVEGSELDRVLHAIERRPADVPPKQTYPIEPAMRTDVAMKAILLALAETIRRNEDGIRRDLDTEFLHDFRVAVRRTRSALGQVPDLFPARTLGRFRRGFSWLGSATGPLRDLDVYLLQIPDFTALLPARHAGSLEPFTTMLERDRRAELVGVVRAIDSRRYDALMDGWFRFLQRPVPRSTRLARAALPATEVARERVWRSYRRVIKRGRKIERDSPPDPLHRLRIECKKLRYLLEFFAPLFGKAEVATLIGSLRKLQTNLGDFNDLAVQQTMLAQFEERLARGDAPPRTLAALELLRERFATRQVEERAVFHARFAAFSAPKVGRRFRSLFGPRKNGS